jgi:tRNA(Ile)-lysidine synthase
VTDLLQRVEENIQNRRLLKRGQAVLVAVSGGLDSMALLHLLHELSSRHRWKLTVAHFNHQLRGRSSDADEKLVRQTAAAMRLPFVAGRANVREFAQKSKLSVEMAARKLRHDFFAHAAKERKIRIVALAHHADDQVELFFLRVLRGAGGEGLAGMKWRSPSPVDSKIMLVRPLLDATKAELRGFVRESRIRFRDDATNTSHDMPRNRVRNELLPLLLRHYQPALAKTVLRLMEIVGAEADLAGETARQWLRSSGRQFAQTKSQSRLTSAATIKKENFTSLPVAIQRRVLQLQLTEAGVPAVFELIESLRQSADVPVNLGPQLSVLREATGAISLRLTRPSDFNANETVVKPAGRAGEVTFDGVCMRWWFDVVKKIKRPATQPACESFDADKVGGRITLRHWRPGDRFQPIGLKSSVKLQDLFTNRKIPRARRRELMLAVAENREIFWVEGLRISENFKLTPQTNRQLVWRWQHPRTAPVFLPLLPKGGEGWGEEPVVSKIKFPHPGPLPAQAGRGSWGSQVRPRCLKTA